MKKKNQAHLTSLDFYSYILLYQCKYPCAKYEDKVKQPLGYHFFMKELMQVKETQFLETVPLVQLECSTF